MIKKSFGKKLKNLLISTFAFGTLFSGSPAQAQKKNWDEEEFRKEQQANRAEFEAYKKQQEIEWKNYKDSNKNKTEKTSTYKKIATAPSKPAVANSPIKNPEQYKKMLGLLPQMLYFMDVVDNKNLNIKVESNKRMYYDQKAEIYANKFGTLNDNDAEALFAQEFQGVQIIKTGGLRFVSYKGKGYEIKPNGQALWDADCRKLGPNSDINTRISKAIALKQERTKRQHNKLRR